MSNRAVLPRRRRAVGDVLFGCCLLVSLGGLGIAALGEWRQGGVIIALGLLLSAGLRMVLPEDMAGMLRVRRRWVDVVALTLLGVTLLVLALVVPKTQ